MVIREEMTSNLAQDQNARMYRLLLVAAVFLPLSFLSGVMGMNTAGLPSEIVRTSGIPTLSQWALITMVLLLGFVAFMRRRQLS